MELFPAKEMSFRWKLIGLAALNTLFCIFLEDFVMEKGVQSLWNKYGGPRNKTKYSTVETWLENHASEWPVLSLPRMESNETLISPKSKSYPFTVEVVLENTLDNKLEFSPKDTLQHVNAASLLNSANDAVS